MIDRPLHSFALRVALIVSLLLAAGCGPNVYDEIELMPAPTIYADAGLNPFAGVTDNNFNERTKLFYATDRMPSSPRDLQAFYNNKRGHLLRTGVADVEIDPPLSTWDEVRRTTLMGERSETYELHVSDVREYGVMPFNVTKYMETPPSPQEMEAAGRKFAAQINSQIAQSGNKDVYIYIHGYNVDFDYSTLVSKELQHFLGYQGAFISYNWTATPSQLAYFRDQESAIATRRSLRSLIEFLSDHTEARRIHVIGYSAGARLALEAVYQIALRPKPRPRVGRLILIASDLDRSFFLQAVEDSLMDAVSDVTVYQTRTDSALALSRFVFGRERLGQAADADTLQPFIQTRLAEIPSLHIVDASEAERADDGNGHHYFRASPWVSSDLILSLLTDRNPGERGLVRSPGEAIWKFPSDYPLILETIASGR